MLLFSMLFAFISLFFRVFFCFFFFFHGFYTVMQRQQYTLACLFPECAADELFRCVCFVCFVCFLIYAFDTFDAVGILDGVDCFDVDAIRAFGVCHATGLCWYEYVSHSPDRTSHLAHISDDKNVATYQKITYSGRGPPLVRCLPR